jgi:hypothetical protein
VSKKILHTEGTEERQSHRETIILPSVAFSVPSVPL